MCGGPAWSSGDERRRAATSGDERRRAEQLEDENRKLKQPIADLSLGKHILQDVLAKALPLGRRRKTVAHVEASRGVSGRRSYLALSIDRSSVRYVSHKPARTAAAVHTRPSGDANAV